MSDELDRLHSNENERLESLARSGLLDSGLEERFDRITRLVTLTLGVPVALVSLVDKDRQYFKSAVGLPEPWASCRETPLSHSFCQYVVKSAAPLKVSDARRDPLVASNGAVTDLNVAAYLGVPLRSADGQVLGSLCAIDAVPHVWTDRDEDILRQLAAIVEEQIGLTNSVSYWQTILNTMPQIVWSTQPDGFHDFYNDRWYEFTGVPPGSTDGEGWNGMFHADDQDRAWARWRHSLETGDPYEIEYRLRNRLGEYRWTLGRALPIRNRDGVIERWFGTCTDIHELKESEASRDLVSRELAHRIQNIFTVVNSLISMSARSVPEARGFADQVSARIFALSQAHRYVKLDSDQKPLADRDRTVHGLIQSIMAPYRDEANGAEIIVEGRDVAIELKVATSLALILHELATNSVKYGALSSASGTLWISCAAKDGLFQITWRERGGPAIVATPERLGFGSRLVSTMLAQLGGSFDRRWEPEGLTAEISFPSETVARI